MTIGLISCVTSNKTGTTEKAHVYYKTVNFKTAKNISILSIDSSSLKKKDTYLIKVNDNPLTINFKMDSINKKVSILTNRTMPKRVYLVDSNHNFSVWRIPPKRTFILYSDSSIQYFRYPTTTNKGTINFTVSIPWVNFFHSQTNYGIKNFTGFLGIEGGIEYYFKDNKYISLNYGSAIDFPLPFVAAIDYFGEHHITSSTYLSLRKNNSIKHFDFGYGLNYSSHVWKLFNNMDTNFIPIKSKNNGLGLSLSAQYRFNKFFRFGLLYQPVFIEFSNMSKLTYQHFISIEFIAKFPTYLFRKKQKHSR